MKTRYLLILLIAWVCLISTSCDPQTHLPEPGIDEFTVVKKSSFANSFIRLDSITAEQYDHSEFTIRIKYHTSDKYYNWYGYCYDFPISQQYNKTRNAIYEKMNERHCDTSFNQYCTADFLHLFSCRNYVCFDINTIDVIGSEDFDEQHPAGTSLNDLIRFVGITPSPYIKSGYVDEYDWQTGVLNERIVESLYGQIETANSNVKYTHLVDKPLTEVLPEDLMILGGDKDVLENLHVKSCTAAFLVFTQKPTKGYKQPLIIKITAFDGKQNVKADIPVEITF